MKKILVIGSISIDNTIFTQKLPTAGTTTVADSYFCNVGGKGANQACAAHFLGADVSFIGAVGKDNNGELVIKFLKEQGLKSRSDILPPLIEVGASCSMTLMSQA